MDRQRCWGRRASSALALIGLVALLSVPTTVASDEQKNTDLPSPDALWYADHFDVSVEVAQRNLALQTVGANLESELLGADPEAFGGMWLEHVPQFKIVVATTDLRSAAIAATLEESGLAGLVELRQVASSLADLERQLAERRESTNGRDGAQVDIDVMNNRLVEREGVVTVLATNLMAGKRVASATLECTSGFTVRGGFGPAWDYGLSTAAHCHNGLTYQGGIALQFQSEVYSGSTDAQWHKSAGNVMKNWANDGVTLPNLRRTITGKWTRVQQIVNATYCSYGINSNFKCGILTTKTNACATPSPQSTCMRLSSAGNSLVLAGDSGGPVFTGNDALGIIHACDTTSADSDCNDPNVPHKLIYIATNYVESGLGVSILTAPPP